MTKDEAMITVGEVASRLERLPFHFQNDKDVVKAAVTEKGYCIRFASGNLQNDKEIIILALKDTRIEFKDYKELRCDKEVALAALHTEIHNYKYICYDCKELRVDEEIVNFMKKHNPYLLVKYNRNFLENKEFVKYVFDHPKQLQERDLLRFFNYEMPKEFQYDREIVLAAVAQNGSILSYLSAEFTNDPEIVEVATAQKALKHQWNIMSEKGF